MNSDPDFDKKGNLSSCDHTFNLDGICISCKYECPHHFSEGVCEWCDFKCEHLEEDDHWCLECGEYQEPSDAPECMDFPDKEGNDR